MERYLVYDAGCSACSDLAQSIQDTAGNKLRTINIRDGQARVLLDRAYPSGWRFAPYLVTVRGGETRAWSGSGMALRLGLVLGPRKAWRIRSLARQSSATPAPGVNPRRNFLKLSGAAAAVAASYLALRPTGRASAYTCGSCTEYQCDQPGGYQCRNNCDPNIYCAYWQIWNCIDPCGDDCGQIYQFRDCNGCCG